MRQYLPRQFPAVLFLIVIVVGGCQSNKEDKTLKDSEVSIQTIDPGTSDLYELRTYYAADGKLDALLERFREHTLSLFQKHGMENIAYWIPIDNVENTLIYIIKFPDEERRKASWDSFREDPNWIAAKEASEVDGSLVDSVKSQLLTLTDFSPAIEMVDKDPRIFEFRTYYCNDGKLTDLHTRFREHTMKIFENHEITNIVYFDFMEGQNEASNTLLYFLSHKSPEAAKSNWQAFLDDPEWQSVYAASIENGKLVDHLSSVFLKTTDFSPMK